MPGVEIRIDRIIFPVRLWQFQIREAFRNGLVE